MLDSLQARTSAEVGGAASSLMENPQVRASVGAPQAAHRCTGTSRTENGPEGTPFRISISRPYWLVCPCWPIDYLVDPTLEHPSRSRRRRNRDRGGAHREGTRTWRTRWPTCPLPSVDSPGSRLRPHRPRRAQRATQWRRSDPPRTPGIAAPLTTPRRSTASKCRRAAAAP